MQRHGCCTESFIAVLHESAIGVYGWIPWIPDCLYSQSEAKVGLKQCMLHAAAQLHLLYLLSAGSTRSGLVLLQSVLLLSPHHATASSIYIYHKVSHRRPCWTVCSLEIAKAGVWLESRVFESKHGSLGTSSGSSVQLQLRKSIPGPFVYLFPFSRLTSIPGWSSTAVIYSKWTWDAKQQRLQWM